MGDTFASLEAEYCPPLDPALVSAILSDFDLSDERSVQNARATLDPLKESAAFEESTEFDASGTGARGRSLEDENPHAESSGSASRDNTSQTSLSNALSSAEVDPMLEDGDRTLQADRLESLDEETKIRLLGEVLENRLSRHDISYTLRKCNGRWHAAMEELLNLVYLSEASYDDGTKLAPRGVDGFSEDNIFRRSRPARRKNKQSESLEDSQSNFAAGSPPREPLSLTNKWKTADQEIDFIATRTGLPPASVRFTYFQNGASLASTLAALLKSHVVDGAPNSASDEVSEETTAAVLELGSEFPSIAADDILALIRLTHPSTASAHELAKALTAPRGLQPPPSGIRILPQYARPAEDLDPDAVPSPIALGHAGASVGAGGGSAEQRGRAYAEARDAAFAQARAAARRAKSDPLYGGAAAYYGQVGRELAGRSARDAAAAADALAARQSTAAQLDLHGVDVLNATRIARAHLLHWWAALGEDRVNGRRGLDARRAGFRIVVGSGTHSAGGKGKLGPAVKAMLKTDGWKFDDQGPVILVSGRAKKEI